MVLECVLGRVFCLCPIFVVARVHGGGATWWKDSSFHSYIAMDLEDEDKGERQKFRK